LSRCLRVLKPGGILVYSTYSIEPAENELLVASILESTPGYEPVKLRHSFPPDDQKNGGFCGGDPAGVKEN